MSMTLYSGPLGIFGAKAEVAFLGCPTPEDLANLQAWRARVAGRPSVARVAGAMAWFLRGQGHAACEPWASGPLASGTAAARMQA